MRDKDLQGGRYQDVLVWRVAAFRPVDIEWWYCVHHVGRSTPIDDMKANQKIGTKSPWSSWISLILMGDISDALPSFRSPYGLSYELIRTLSMILWNVVRYQERLVQWYMQRPCCNIHCIL
jgi:hypothetical protein